MTLLDLAHTIGEDPLLRLRAVYTLGKMSEDIRREGGYYPCL